MENSRPAPVPKFRYHPEPFASGALVEAAEACECCGLARGILCAGHVYCEAEVERVCPWCVADGSAAAKWDAEFTDGDFRDRWGGAVDLPPEDYDEVFRRTPPVVAFQSVRWWVHCERPAAFLRIEDDRVRFRCIVCGKGYRYRDLD